MLGFLREPSRVGARKEDHDVSSANRALSHAFRRPLLLLLLLLLPAAQPAVAAETVLELVGAGRAQVRALTLTDLAALPQVTVRTENEFSDGVVAYRGPLVRDVLAELGLDRLRAVRLVAANDYYVDIPTSDFADFDVILATEADGMPLSRRDKGPLWLMYPISDHAALRNPVYLRRLIWQVVRIEAL
jgi:hypothetical protein